jgi:phosphoenolpyruvate---glycerone phosphotransferase subunit DhaK
MMKKILNDPKNVVDEATEGLVAAYGGAVKQIDNLSAIVKTTIADGKVVLLVGGGSGHEPLFSGFVGDNMADAAAAGAIFTSPSPDVIFATTTAAHRGNGVLYLYGNYAGDNMNFDIAAELAGDEDIEIKTVRIWDDVASAPLDQIEERRGIAGDVFVIKIAGGAAATLDSLDEVYQVSVKARDNTRSMGVALKPGTMPETGKPFFELADDEIEIGMGVHGEPGVSREKLPQADDLVERMTETVVNDLPFESGDKVALLINNLGSTTMTELLIINRKVQQILQDKGIQIHDTQMGSYCTSQEMAGFSITLMKLDDELQQYYDMPAKSFGFSKV